jgi:uncharacterized membrane protein YuzA (DUF378 family)
MKFKQNNFMRLTCIICLLNLIILGICSGVTALSGFELLLLLCFENEIVLRCFWAICSVSALFLIYALIVLKPFKKLK